VHCGARLCRNLVTRHREGSRGERGLDQLPLRQQGALVNAALSQCFGMWNQRVEQAFEAAAGLAPRDQLAAILHAAIDSFADLRSSVHACVESYAPALRSQELRERLAAKTYRQAGLT
jgi:hypothetical protein